MQKVKHLVLQHAIRALDAGNTSKTSLCSIETSENPQHWPSSSKEGKSSMWVDNSKQKKKTDTNYYNALIKIVIIPQIMTCFFYNLIGHTGGTLPTERQ